MHPDIDKKAQTNHRVAPGKPRHQGLSNPVQPFIPSAGLVQRTQSNPAMLSSADVMHLQRTLGNCTTTQLIQRQQRRDTPRPARHAENAVFAPQQHEQDEPRKPESAGQPRLSTHRAISAGKPVIQRKGDKKKSKNKQQKDESGTIKFDSATDSNVTKSLDTSFQQEQQRSRLEGLQLGSDLGSKAMYSIGADIDASGIDKVNNIANYSGLSASYVSNVFGVVSAITKLGKPGDALAKIEAGFTLSSAVSKTGSSIAKTVAATGSAGKEGAELIGEITSLAGNGFTALANGMKTVSQIKGAVEDLDQSHEKRFANSLPVINTILDTAQTFAKMAKTILDLISSAGSAAAAAAAAVPGFGLVINGCKLLMKAYSIVKTAISYHFLKKRNAELKKKLSSSGTTKDFFEKDGNTRLRKLDDAISDNPAVSGKYNLGNDDLKNLKEYHFVHEMKTINRKRLVREGILVGLELSRVAANILKLTGVGAGAGVGLSAGAATAEVALPVVRFAKQKIRDKTAPKNRKTTEHKHERRMQHVRLVFNMIHDLKSLDVATWVDRVALLDNYIQSAGVNPKAWYKQSSQDPTEGFKALYKAMQKRQFG